MLKELFPGSTDFTVAFYKIHEISKHFSAMLPYNRMPFSLFKVLRNLQKCLVSPEVEFS